MERINPYNLFGPRAYFTDFDYKIVRLKHNKKEYKKEVLTTSLSSSNCTD